MTSANWQYRTQFSSNRGPLPMKNERSCSFTCRSGMTWSKAYHSLQIPRKSSTHIMSVDDFRGICKEWDAFDQVIPDLHVKLHDLSFFIGKGPRFEENCVRYCQFADVMKPRSHGDVSHLTLQAAHGPGNLEGVQKYAPRVSSRRTVP